MILLGAHHGGPELRATAIEMAITGAMNAAIEARGEYEEGSTPAVNVVFCTPGSIMKQPDWDHGRIGKYSPARKLLLVQVAVPQSVVNSGSALDFVIGELHGANALAFEFYREKGMAYPLADAERLVLRIKELAASRLNPGQDKVVRD